MSTKKPAGIRTVKLLRLKKQKEQTLGVISVDTGNMLFVAKSLELGWHNNAKSISCIPEGEYLCKWTYSGRFKRFMYEVLNVKDRAGIRMHSANYNRELHGCIAMGSALKDMNNDGLQDMTNSGATMREFELLMNQQDFWLEVKSI